MDPRYRGTVVEEILPLIDTRAAAALKRHGVTKEQYALWVYKRATNRTGAQAAVVIMLCLTMLFALVNTLLGESGVALSGETIVKLLAIGATIAVILSLTTWTMRHGSSILKQHLASIGFLHHLSADYLNELPRWMWEDIKTFEPDLHRFRMEKAVYRKPPALTLAQQDRIATLRPWRRTAGWAALGCLALMFFVGQGGLTIVTSLTVTMVGVWLLLASLQVYIAGQFEDKTTGMTAFGKPARFIAVVEIVFSFTVVLVGVTGMLTWI